LKLHLGKILLALAVLAAAGTGWYWYASRSAGSEAKYRVGKVERGPLQAVVVASGTLAAVTTVQVGSQVSGQILEIFADFNTQVKKDQVIAKIDPQSFELRVNQTRADVDAARSAVAVATNNLAAQRAETGRVRINLADAERDLNRKKMLVEKNFMSPAELDKAKTVFEATREQLKAVEAQIGVSQSQVESAQAAVKQREALLKQAQVDLERTIIRAPVDGTVILRNVDAGQTVAASLQAPVLFTIARDLRDMQVEAAIDEADVGRLRVGQTVSFTVDAFPRRNFNGEIKQVRKSPVNVQNVISYTVVISAANPDQNLLPGMTANVRVVVDSRDNVLKVPNAALRFRPAGGTAGAGPAPGDAKGGEAQAAGNPAQQFRARVYAELKPDDSQKAKLDTIFDDVRQKMAQMRDLPKDGDRKKAGERLRSETRARVMDVLDEKQKPVYEKLLAEMGQGRAGGGGVMAAGRVWVPMPGEAPKPVDLRTGLTDGTSTEIQEGPLKEGDAIILGPAETPAAGAAKKGPGGPRMF
jgi:HlyD family secretion protein